MKKGVVFVSTGTRWAGMRGRVSAAMDERELTGSSRVWPAVGILVEGGGGGGRRGMDRERPSSEAARLGQAQTDGQVSAGGDQKPKPEGQLRAREDRAGQRAVGGGVGG